MPAGYERLDDAGLRRWLAAQPELAARLGGTPDAWQVGEVSDGNLNLVYVVKGSAGGVCVKQSLPYVRVVGESWPMPLERAHFEQLYLRTSEPYISGLAPVLLHYDPERFALAVELLAEHIVLRRGLLAGQRYATAAGCVAEYVARRAFATSVLADPFELVNERLAAFSRNHALIRVTVDLIFTHPYVVHERNRWTTPQLDDVVASLQADAPLKAAVAQLGHRFLTVHEALLHGDLHTGSVMVTATDTRVIDAEFATYGPIGFDLGLFVGNLLMAYFSQPGHEFTSGERAGHGEWILAQIGELWREFVAKFDALWCAQRLGDGYPSSFFSLAAGGKAFALERERWFAAVLSDTLGYAGAEIVRRIVGFAHILDFESIDDPDLRSRLERRALAFARELIVTPQGFTGIENVLEAARRQNSWPADKHEHDELTIESAIDAVIAAGRDAAARGWVPATAGNFSVRAGDLIAITRTGRDKGRLRAEDIAVVSLASPFGDDLSAEAALHFARYRADAQVGAIFHVHMTIAAALGRRHAHEGQLILHGWELQKAFSGVSGHLTAVRVPILRNDQDTQALAAAAERELQRADSGLTAPGYLIAGHGVNAWGRTSADAQRHLEAFEALLTLHKDWLENPS